MSIDFGKEQVVELPSTDRWFDPQGRTARVFVKGPHRGVNEDTGLCLLLHGQGGRQNDISWKMLRRSLAEKHNMLVVGVNYFGTSLSERDGEFINQQVLSAYQALAFDQNIVAQFKEGKLVLVAPEDMYFFENHRVALLSTMPYPDEYWDWGVIQAIDAINALYWAASSAGITPKRVAMVSRSAGAQIAYQILKFAPRLFSSYLDLGGVCFGGSKNEWLAQLLRDPFNRVAPNEFGGLEMHNEEVPFHFFLGKRWPLANYGKSAGFGPSFKDEVAIRDVFTPNHLSEELSLAKLVVEQGVDDHCSTPAFKEEVLAPYQARGVDAKVRTIGEEDLDGRLRDNKGHTFMKDYNALVLEEHEAVFQAEHRGEAFSPENAAEERRFECETGSYFVKPAVSSTIRFKRGR